MSDYIQERERKAVLGIVRCGNAITHPSKLVLLHLLMRGPKPLSYLCADVGLSADAVTMAFVELADLGLIDKHGSITANILAWAEREQVQ